MRKLEMKLLADVRKAELKVINRMSIEQIQSLYLLDGVCVKFNDGACSDIEKELCFIG